MDDRFCFNTPVCACVFYILSNQIDDLYAWYDREYTLTETEWLIHVSVNYATIGTDNGLSPIWHQAIILSNADLLSIRPLGTI